MTVRPDTLAAPDSEPRFTQAEWLGIVAAIALAGAACAFMLYQRELEKAKFEKARQDMKVLDTAYHTAMCCNRNTLPDYPKEIVPLLTNGEAATIDPWGGQYQIRVFTGVGRYGPRPQFFTITPGGKELVWPPL